jgi:hypothetical protein
MADLLNPLSSPRRFYFTIKGENTYRVIRACSFTEAKALAAEAWMHCWSRIEWLNQ